MKRIALSIGISTALVASCSIQEEDIKTPQQGDVIYYASFEQPAEDGTRVYANEDLLLRWTADDRVSIFGMNTYNQQYKFLGETGDNAGGFNKVDAAEFVTGNAIPHVVSVYPYQSATSISESEAITVSLPSEQHYAENTFGLGANTMVSVTSDNVLQYKNVGGYLRLSLYGEGVSVTSITLKGNNGERIAGKATITMPLDGTPSVVMADDATDEITLVCDTAVAWGKTAEESIDFWFVIPPVTFSKGFSVIVSKMSGNRFEKSTTNSIAIDRNKLSKMSLIKVEAETNNTIFYTSTDERIVTPKKTDAFGPNIVSNEYINGVGILQFDGDVVSIGRSAFADCERLVTLLIPPSVASIGQNAFVNCFNLESVNIPNSVISIGDSAFSCCYNLKSIIIPEGVSVIERSTFSGCLSLSSVSLPESLIEIMDNAFDSCENLNSISLPNNLERIGLCAFAGCGLTSIHLPNNISHLPEGTFTGCNSLKSFSGKYASPDGLYLINEGVLLAAVTKDKEDYVVPSSITRIGDHTFSLSKIKNITIPESVTSIGQCAFFLCYNLNSITINCITPPSGGQSMFSETNDAPIYVPAESVEAYKTAQYWSDYADRIQAIPE